MSDPVGYGLLDANRSNEWDLERMKVQQKSRVSTMKRKLGTVRHRISYRREDLICGGGDIGALIWEFTKAHLSIFR
jgi:hypothetical protein